MQRAPTDCEGAAAFFESVFGSIGSRLERILRCRLLPEAHLRHAYVVKGEPLQALFPLKMVRRSVSMASSSQPFARESSLIRSDRAVSSIFLSPKERSLSARSR